MGRARTGLELLRDEGGFGQKLKGGRIGLVTNPTGITADFRTSVSVCAELPGVRLTTLFACEHGLYGEKQAGVRFEDGTDAETGLPVRSLYGRHKKPTPEMLAEVDAVLFDMQDIGVRFYTYLSTLLYVMQACAENGKRLVVLDRPNPLGGLRAEGGLLRPGYESMVGAWRMPIRTGLTIGETAAMANGLLGLGCELDVVPLSGWSREMDYAATGLPWIMPSPNMPTLDTVRVYPGTCLLEGTNLSEGRGTTRPFEWFGAPWLDGHRTAEALNARKLPGVHFHPVYATPAFSKHAGELCGGVRLFVTDAAAFEPVRAGLYILHTVASLYPERFEWLPPFREGMKPFVDLLAGGDEVRHAVGDEVRLRELLVRWEEEARQWQELRRDYLLY
ncbi:exo-beta-N-acetylmuramidase NamZ domain-containing protein [Paenibacillus thermoaerophilus]|uniref:Exo-beta-N-acetylmuramidase NamZ domain-containing protein n=1 Tax=Paenibacillus thermoaerophilus TaxID=1215385 RepID=A0ABW2V3U9_9BACL|nr:DUF1343 domain-containing protein [Paenibacillus thermoaerophilus]TMV11123.1 DUF1343 domain-containing protein [Paenibacillus thermoaerophilus]